MMLRRLLKHWRKKSDRNVATRTICLIRASRSLMFIRQHRELFSLPLHREYLFELEEDHPCHHLSYRHYLAKDLDLRQRVNSLMTHYRFEDVAFDCDYKQHVYKGSGLVLWTRTTADTVCEVRLAKGSRIAAEGDLTLSMYVDGIRIHRYSFSWAASRQSGPAGPPVVPMVGCSQGHCAAEEMAFRRFEEIFPNNSPNFFCFAAMQGVAKAIGADHLLGVPAALQVTNRTPPGKPNFDNTYDAFWGRVGGVQLPSGLFVLPVPTPNRPLAEKAAKHRKRTALRRAHWHEITDSVATTLRARHVHVDLQTGRGR